MCRLESGIRIESDFSDYYDSEFSQSSQDKVYRRFKRDNFPKGKALKVLRDKGISTLDIRPVRDYINPDELLVIYTDPSLHDGRGKILCTWREAMFSYSNCLASLFIRDTGGVSLKFLQVGSRRFRLMMKNEDTEKVFEHGKIVSVDELQPELNFGFALPVFSIDYVSCSNEMIAVDFNRVQSLEKISFNNIMSASEVVSEIRKAVDSYNIV